MVQNNLKGEKLPLCRTLLRHTPSSGLKRRPQRLLFIALILVLFAGCSKKNSVADKIPQKIICLSPASAEICFAIGAGSSVVACSEYCDFPEEVKKLPVVGGFDGKTLSIEKILSFQPAFLYLTDGMHNFLIPKLEEFGIDYYVSVANSVSSVVQEIKDIGKITGHEQEAEKVAAEIMAEVNAHKGVAEMCAAEGVAEKPAASGEDFGAKGETSPSLDKPGIYWEVWNEPYMSAGALSFINDVISVSGAKNIFGDVQEAYPVVSQETLIVRQPEIILIPESSGISVENVQKRSGWEVVPAVKNGRIYIVNDNLYTRPGPRIGLVIKELAEIVESE